MSVQHPYTPAIPIGTEDINFFVIKIISTYPQFYQFTIQGIFYNKFNIL